MLALTATAWAGVAPPEQLRASSIAPDGQTQVVMRAERVVIEVQPSGGTAIGKVKGNFTLYNTGTADEAVKVRFPTGSAGVGNSSSGDFPQVQNFGVSVGGIPLPVTVISTPNPATTGVQMGPVKWAAFDVNFPAGRETTVNVTYNIPATGNPPSARFSYVLATGAGWKDAIGSVEIVLRLPYAASNENVFYEETTRGSQFIGNEVRWRWNNLEPTANDNLSVTILTPSAWQAILAARAAVDAQPNDARALAALARAYDAAITSRFPIEEHDPFATRSEETYSLAIAADPTSAPLHAEYARALWKHMAVQASVAQEDPYVRKVLAEISAALSLDPQNAEARALLAEVQSGVQGTVVLPTAVKSAQPTSSISVTGSSEPDGMPTPLVEASPGVAPTITIAPPMPTTAARSTPTASTVNPQPGGMNNALLVLGIAGLPAIATLTTFLIVLRRREQG